MGESAIKAALSDIDGTLLVTGGGGAAWQRGFEELYGVEADVAEHTFAGPAPTSRCRRSSAVMPIFGDNSCRTVRSCVASAVRDPGSFALRLSGIRCRDPRRPRS